jgi:hypothetical protein
MLLLVAGCYDLSFNTDEHTVTDFAVLAVNVEPPEIRPDTIITARVLIADPAGSGREIWCGWRVNLADVNIDSGRDILYRLKPRALGGDAIQLPFFWPGDDPIVLNNLYLSFNIYLCVGEWENPSKFLSGSHSVHEQFCKEGPMLMAYKRIGATDPRYPQNNPSIDHLWVNDMTLRPTSEGGEARIVCSDDASCSALQTLSLYIGEDSLEEFSIQTETYATASDITDFTSNSDVLESNDSVEKEIVAVDWYVSGGRILRPSSYPETLQDFLGPYTTQWRPDGKGVYALWVVVRDIRGGNSFETYRIVVTDAFE